jgi:hypothetical protein
MARFPAVAGEPRGSERPRIVMTLLVRDEVDIIRDNLDFHLNAGVDLVLAMDNHSEDGTTDVLREYEKAGGLVYLYEPSDEYLQDQWVTSLARRAALQHGADWVINADADEFFLPAEGTLADALAAIPAGVGAVSIRRHDMVPIVRPRLESPAMEMVYRKKVSLEWVAGHQIVDKIIHRALPDVQVSRGSHVVTSEFVNEAKACDSIFTFHFPIRSQQQFSRKVRNMAPALSRAGVHLPRYESWDLALKKGELAVVYNQYELGMRQIAEKLANGDIIKDDRLARRLGGIRGEMGNRRGGGTQLDDPAS